MRQGLAIAIVLNTVELGMRRKRLAFFGLTLLAMGVHSSAIAWFLTWPILRFRGNRFLRLGLVASIAVLMVAAPGFLYWAVNQVAPGFAWYFESNYATTRPVEPSLIAITVAVFVLGAFLVRSGSEGDRYGSGIVNMMGLNVAILGGTLFVAYLFIRLNSFFAPIQILMVPLLLSAIREPVPRRFLAFGIMVVYLISFYLQFIHWGAHGVFPYESIFSR